MAFLNVSSRVLTSGGGGTTMCNSRNAQERQKGARSVWMMAMVPLWAMIQWFLHSSFLSYVDSSSRLSSIHSFDETSTNTQNQFPKTLHYIWPNKNFSFGDDDPDNVEQERTLQLVNTIKRSNPDWTVKVWTDDECFHLMRTRFPDFINTWENLSPRLKMWDAVRPAILFAEGGIYLDHDIECNDGVHFSNWLRPETTLLLREPTYDNKKLGNHFMGSIPNHPLWKLYIKNIVEEIPLNLSVGMHTGPRQLYPTFQEYYMKITEDERTTIRLLAMNEVDMKGECERAEEFEEYCSQPRCSHTHTVSPAELKGQDDNHEQQVFQFKKKLLRVKENVVGKPHNYSIAKCTCSRMTQLVARKDNGTLGIFVHIPKTGGTTVESMLGLNTSCHATAHDLRRCNLKDFTRALKFAALRHPVERALSLYRYAQSGGNGKLGDLKKYNWVQNVSFDEFVDAIPRQSDPMYAPQTHFIVDHYNTSSFLVDELLCTESLESDWKRLVPRFPFLEKFGTFPSERLRVTSTLNTSTRMLHHVDNATLAKLKDIYAQDFVIWEDYCN